MVILKKDYQNKNSFKNVSLKKMFQIEKKIKKDNVRK